MVFVNPDFCGEMIQFEEDCFSSGWFNHQLVMLASCSQTQDLSVFIQYFAESLELQLMSVTIHVHVILQQPRHAKSRCAFFPLKHLCRFHQNWTKTGDRIGHVFQDGGNGEEGGQLDSLHRNASFYHVCCRVVNLHQEICMWIWQWHMLSRALGIWNC